MAIIVDLLVNEPIIILVITIIVKRHIRPGDPISYNSFVPKAGPPLPALDAACSTPMKLKKTCLNPAKPTRTKTTRGVRQPFSPY
jgi:hypothetical protein